MPQSPIPSSSLSRTVLPHMDDALIGAALSVTELGAWLLASCGLSLLCVPLGAGREGLNCSAVPISLHLGPELALARTIAAEARNRALFAKLSSAADALFADLATRWPSYAAPPLVGLVTDGTGLALSPDDPWPLCSGWLQRQQRGAASLIEIVPFDPAGAWPRLMMGH